MKLYKGDKVMQMVDKDQVETCLEAGWSRTQPEEVELEEVEPEESEEVEEVLKIVPKKNKIKPLKKKR